MCPSEVFDLFPTLIEISFSNCKIATVLELSEERCEILIKYTYDPFPDSSYANKNLKKKLTNPKSYPTILVKNTPKRKDVFKTCIGKIHGVGVYATHSVRIWWFRNKFSLFQLKRM